MGADPGRRVDPHPERGGGPKESPLLDAADRRQGSGEAEQLRERAAALLDRERESARSPRGRQSVEEALGARIEWHGLSRESWGAGDRGAYWPLTARAFGAPMPAIDRGRGRDLRTAPRRGGPCRRPRSRCAPAPRRCP